MAPFDRIYLETSVLIASNWPRLSATLETLFLLAQFLEVKVFLPAAAEIELEEHWLRNLDKKYAGINRNAKDLSTYLGDPNSRDVQLQLPDRESVLRSYRARVRKVKESAGLEGVPTTVRPVDELFRMAARHEAPFKEEGAGFQDTAIFLSVVDHLKRQPGSVGAFVSQDGIFTTKAEEITKILKSSQVDLEIFDSIEKVNEVLRQRVREEIRKEMQQENARADKVLRERLSDIERFIFANLEVYENDLGIGRRILEIRSFKIDDLKNVQSSLTLRTKDDEPIKVSCDVELELQVVVESVFYPVAPVGLKIGEQAPRPESKRLREVLGQRSMEEETLPWLAEVEAEAPPEDSGYKRLQFLSIRSKGLRLPRGLGLGPIMDALTRKPSK